MRRWSPLFIGFLLLILACAGLDRWAVQSAHEDVHRRVQKLEAQRQERLERQAQLQQQADAAPPKIASMVEAPKQVVDSDHVPRSVSDKVSFLVQMPGRIYGECRLAGLWEWRLRQANRLRASERSDLTPKQQEAVKADVRDWERALVPNNPIGILGAGCIALGPDEPPPWLLARWGDGVYY